MKCTTCGGLCEWQGPASSLTHTLCLSCGAINTGGPDELGTCEYCDGPLADDDTCPSCELLHEAERIKHEAELAKERAAREAAERALAAPDKEKLATLAASIRALTVPELSSKRAAKLMPQISEAIEMLAQRVETAATAF